MSRGRERATNLALRLTPEALRHVRRGHPWIFDGSIASVRGGRHGDGTGEPGDLAIVFDDRRRLVAVGLWDPESPIRVKVLHAGSPRRIDGAFWRDRVEAALARRGDLVEDPRTTGWRVLHGEGDGLPGLVVDRYGSGRSAALVAKVYTAAWFPHLDDLLDSLVDALEIPTVVLRLARSVERRAPTGMLDGTVLRGGPVTGPVRFAELGLRFTADVVRGQKTGWFLDQRDNRRRVGAMADGSRVLDVFCAGGGFTVHAAVGGATLVHSIDSSPHAIAETERHIAVNRGTGGASRTRHRSTVGDAFDVMASLRRRHESYDLVVVDPPNFAPRRSDVEGAMRAHTRLARLAVELLEPGGTLVQASCSSRLDGDDLWRAMCAGAGAAGVGLLRSRRTGQPSDHPIGPPETAYLHAVFARIER